jgi:predicted RNA methylase
MIAGRSFEILDKLRKRGVFFAFHYVRDVILFDLMNGTDTYGRKLDSTIVDESIYYVPSFTSTVEETIGHVKDVLGAGFDDWQFVDIGSGKGKVILIYASSVGKHANHAPIGIEYDAELAKIGNANIRKMRLANTGARIIADVASNFSNHISGDRLIVFMYNPFFGSLFYDFVARLQKIPHFLIYVDPVERAHLAENGYVVLVERQGRYNADSWIIATRQPAR